VVDLARSLQEVPDADFVQKMAYFVQISLLDEAIVNHARKRGAEIVTPH
jgi:hypothetical protein